MSTSGNKIAKTNLERAKEKIFFEKQEGSLCGQHCLNNALQSPMFSPIELSAIAVELDEKERLTMAQGGIDSKEYKEFMTKPSSNFDDSGYFSVQVLSEALKNVNLEMVPLKSNDPRAAKARELPTEERLYICHMEDHWFSLRRLGTQWLNLNSVLNAPELVTDTYFCILLKTLQNDGYSIFVVFGELPECEADNLFATLRRGSNGEYIEEIDDSAGHKLGSDLGEDESLARAIQLSLARTPAEVIRAQREIFIKRLSSTSCSPSGNNSGHSSSTSSSSAVCGKPGVDNPNGSPTQSK